MINTEILNVQNNVVSPYITVTNLALGKEVLGSSTGAGGQPWGNAVDGRTHVTDFTLLFHTSFELYPWMTVTLGRLSIVKSVTLYNRVDDHGKFGTSGFLNSFISPLPVLSKETISLPSIWPSVCVLSICLSTHLQFSVKCMV
jgi:hypothetical protein